MKTNRFSFFYIQQTNLINNGIYSTICFTLGRENGFHFESNCLSKLTCHPCFVGTSLSRFDIDICPKKSETINNSISSSNHFDRS